MIYLRLELLIDIKTVYDESKSIHKEKKCRVQDCA